MRGCTDGWVRKMGRLEYGWMKDGDGRMDGRQWLSGQVDRRTDK